MRGRIVAGLLGILALVVVPFVLREVDPQLEPYPALLLPSGAARLNVGQPTLEIHRLELHSRARDGSLHQLSAHEFLHPIPVQYWPYIAQRGLGLVGPKTTRERSRETASWIGERLDAVGRGDHVGLRVRSVGFLLDMKTGDTRRGKVDWSYEVAVR